VVRLGLEFQEVLRSRECRRLTEEPEGVGIEAKSQIRPGSESSSKLLRRPLRQRRAA